MYSPFHYSFLVKDLASTREFYGKILACKEGRSSETWVDFDFFGHQISAHVHPTQLEPIPCGKVDRIIVPIPHFGAILPWEQFHELATRLQTKIDFIIKPHVRFQGQVGEQATMFFKDFSGNALEFKSFKAPEAMFAV
ncbi:MAG: hypothetical protein KA436_02955 [Oligoflexales bacterium]|nr:hypothetical protein [Oligoflexales bacterium]